MGKKKIISGVLATSIALAATLGGCSLVSSNTAADMNQVIAEVNVANAAALDSELKEFKDAVGTSKVIKRELIAYFLNVGSTYINQYGQTYEQVFNMLVNSLVENSVLTQYSTLYLLKDKAEKESKTSAQIIAEYNAFSSQTQKYEWLLGSENVGKDNVEYSDEVYLAKYSLYSSINSAIDSYEKRIIKEDGSSAGTDTRTAPSGVDTEREDYYPKTSEGKLDYNVYTGYKKYLLADSGVYQKDPVEGTTRVTRIRAYNDFISSLASSGFTLVNNNENLRDILSLQYIEDEYATQLEQQIISKYYDVYEKDQEELLTAGEGESAYAYIQAIYEDKLGLQTRTYGKDESAFSSALGNMNDSTFVLYAPDTQDTGKYGFVYNILLPFSATQSAQLKSLQSLYADSDLDGGYKPEYYIARNEILNQITTTDQRSAWFNGEKEYAFKADASAEFYGKNNGREYLFFENNLTDAERYEELDKYYGKYAYNGKVVKSKDDYILAPNTLNMDTMLDEFAAYVEYACGRLVTVNKVSDYGEAIKNDKTALYKKVSGKDKINYSNFIYATGSVGFTNTDDAYNRENFLKKDGENSQASEQYKALSAVNELQYAYTTDTGVLSQYVGYSVDAGDTSYIKEFEHAAHEAINKGAGNFAVCAGDYGWHLIYVTYTFDNTGSAQYSPDWKTNVKVKGTFENIFYEWIKDNDLKDISSTRRTQIITALNLEGNTVTKYENTYKDLLELDK